MKSPGEYSTFAYLHQLPGGMAGTLKAQLRQHGMEDRLEEVLEEVVRVREDLGHPISATPFSQLMGIQSVLNVVTGDRYSMVPDEVIIYTLGHLGTPPAAIAPEVKDRIMAAPRAKEFVGWEPPQPSLKQLRIQFGDEHMSDEELLSRYLVPREDFEATRLAGPVPTTYEFHDTRATDELIDAALALRRPRYVRIRPKGMDLTLRRSG